MKQKLQFFILFLILQAAALPAQEVIHINNVGDLEYVRYLSRTGNYYRYELMADLNLSGWNWTPIGDSQYPFRGEFRGNGHVIRNLCISSFDQNMGFFGVVENSIITDLGVEGSVSGSYCAGILCGTSSNSSFSRCYVDGEVIGDSHIGGFIGFSLGGDYISDCYFLTESVVFGSEYIGGFIGRVESIKGITSVTTSYSSVILFGSVGGGALIGEASPNTIVEYCCYNRERASLSGIVKNMGVGGRSDGMYIRGYVSQDLRTLNMLPFNFSGNTWQIMDGCTYPHFSWHMDIENICLDKITNYHYTYDVSGNRVLRETVITLKKAGNTKSKGTQDEESGNWGPWDTEPLVKSQIGSFDIIVYPNPTKGHLKIDIKGNSEIEKGEINVYNTNGRRILMNQSVTNSNEIDLSPYPGGVYVMQIILNGKLYGLKIIKE